MKTGHKIVTQKFMKNMLYTLLPVTSFSSHEKTIAYSN